MLYRKELKKGNKKEVNGFGIGFWKETSMVCTTTFSGNWREDPHIYRRFLRMNPCVFHELLALVEPYITRKDTCMQKAIPAGERLAVTLRYIASGK